MFLPRRAWRLRLTAALFCLAAIAMACCCARKVLRHADAAPHTIAPRQHPFDPDWLEVKVILANKCVQCHRPDTHRTDFTTYDALMAAEVDDERVIVPGSPDDSSLWHSVSWNVRAVPDSDNPDQPDMPPEDSEWLTAGQLEIVHRWISNGALRYKLPQTCNIRPLLESDFPSARQCGQCHPKQFEEWSRSMHAYAQHSPVFEAFNLSLIERTGGTIGTFCSRCHTPIGTSLGENGSRRNVHRSRISMEGVTCVVCHRRKDGRYKSNSRLLIAAGDVIDTCVFGPFDDAVHVEGSHPSKKSSYLLTSQFCGECHDVTNPQGVRLEEAFSEWQNSPAAAEGITCQHCHMGPVQGVPVARDGRPLGRAAKVPGIPDDKFPLRHLSDHTFAGPDYSLLPDTEFPYKLDWMYEQDYRDTKSLTPYQRSQLDKLRRRNREALKIADQKRYELLRNGARIKVRHPAAARPGEKVKVAVDVESIFAGHNFPTGFTAERQLWVSVEVRDQTGKLIFASGDLDKNADLLDAHSHEVEAGHVRYDKHLLNFQSSFVTLTNKGTERTVVLSVNRHLVPLNVVRPAAGISASFGRPPGFRVGKRSLPPLKTMGQHYPVHLPDCGGTYQLDVALNFRHLPPHLLDVIGTPHLKHLLEVVTIDRYQGMIVVREPLISSP